MSIFNLLREELNKKRGKQQLVSIKDVAREVPRATLNTAKGIGLEILKTPARWGMGVADVPRTLAGKKPLKKVDIKYPTLWGQMDLGSVQSYARETHDRVQGGETPLGASLGVGGKAILDTVAISSLAEKMMPRLSQPINFSKAGPAYGPQRPTVTETAANKKYNDVMDDIQDTLKHKYDDFVKAGQVPRDAVYKTDQFYTRKVAEGKINDIAQKMDIRFPGKGLGDAYRLRSNPSHTNDDIMFKTARDILDNIPTESGIVTYYNTGGVRGEMNTMVNQSLHAPTVGKGQYLSMDKVSNSQFGDVTHRYLLDKNVKVLDLTKGFHESGYSRVVDYQQAQPLFREALMKTNGDVIKLAKSKGFDGVKVLSDDGANVWLALADDIPVKEIFNTQSLYKYLESLAKVPGGIESIQGLGGKGAAAIGTLIAGAGASLAGVMALKGKKKDQKEVQPLPGGEERISQGERRGPLANFFDKYLKEPLSGVDTEFRPENEDFLTGLKNQGLLNVFNFGGITRSIESREFDRQKELIGTGVEPGRAAQLASLDVRTPSSKRDEMFEEFGVTKEEQKALRVARRWETFDSTLGALDFFPILGTLGKRGLQTAVRKIASTADVKRIEALVRSEFPGLSDAATTKLSRELVPIKDADKVNETINDYVQREAVESLRITRQGTDALKKTREILSPTKAPRMSIRARATKITNTLTDRFIAEFAPLTRMESAIYRANNAVPDARITIGRRFEQLAGSAGKGEVDIGMFQREVLDKIKGMEGAFNEFLFLRRTVDRLQNNPELKKVGEFTVDKANEGLRALRDELGQANYKKIRDLAESQYQKVMDDALRLQLTSGRISQKSYDAIKKGNKFYTPFMLTEKGGVDLTRQGAGQVMEKTDPFVRSIVGIDDDFFKIRDPLQRSAELIYRSRVIAEQNRAMLALADLAKVDKTGIIRKVPVATQKAPAGKGIVRYFDNGVEKALEVPVEVAEVITRMNNVQRKIFGQTFLAMAAKPLRWGATAGNLAFQAVNFILADLPTQALLSKHGIKNPVDLVRYPLDVVYAMYSSFMGNVLGKPNKLFEEFLRSGAANSTMQRAFTPEAFRRQVGLPVGNKVTQKTGRVLNTLAGFASTLEDTTKLMALKRGMRLENIPTFDVDAFTKGMKIKDGTLTATQEKEALSRMYEVVTEVRNWGGSPDFLRRGSETKSLNLLLMFLNARIQGINTGIGTMAGTYGTKRAATAWARVTAGVGLPTLVLMAHNMRPENREDYYKINKTERDNYWMIPQDTYFQDSQGNMVRDYIRIPKRNITQVFSNIIEAGMEFAYEKDPEALLGIGTALVENVSPITMHFDQGVEGFFESLASNVNPAIKVPGEYGTNRNFFYHTDLEPDYIEGVRSKDLPKEERYKDNTHEFYRTLGRISKQSPLKIEHAVRGLTGGFFNQFVGDTPSEGRSALSEAPLFKRFFRSEYMATTDTTESIKGSLEGQAVSSANRNREAKEIMSKMKELAPQDRLTLMSAIKKTDPLLAKRILDKLTEESKGIDFDDRMLRQLNVNNGARAKAIIEIMSGLEPEEKVELFNELARKKIISAKVKEQIFFIIQNKQ